ncbi:hypothetical protein ACFL5G_02635 [Candidatus Margulisiibacteriota bacterium]
MREESLIPRQRQEESVFPESAPMFGITGEEKVKQFVAILKKALPTAKSDNEMIAMEVRAGLEVEGTENLEEVAHIVTNALLANEEIRENALMVAHRILRSVLQ